MAPRPVFRTLPEALEFLATALTASDLDGVSAACAPLPERPGEPVLTRIARGARQRALEQLAERHREHDLRLRYADREFPAGDDFKFGGHASELGHIHVDFERGPDGWRLKDVWICR